MVEAASNAPAGANNGSVVYIFICGEEVVSGAPLTYSASKAALNALYVAFRPLGRRAFELMLLLQEIFYF